MPGMGGSEYRISLDSLPADAQARYWREQIKAPTAAEQRARLEALNLEEQLARQVAREAGIRRREDPIEPLPLNPAEWREARERWERLPRSMRDEAERRAQALRRLDALLKSDRPKMEAFATAATEAGESTSTVRRWAKKVKNQRPADWPLLLASDYGCQGAPEAELHPDAWDYIRSEWLVQSKPTLTAVCRRAQREAGRRGWGELPSIKTIKRRIDKEIPNTVVVLMREGEDALERLYPAQERDYSTLPVHGLWVSDGRKADLFTVFPDGEVRRPLLMFWLDVRSRKALGWAVGKTENTPLVRSSLRDAMTRSKALPREFLLDNGRAYASKEITGGQPNRYRFKVNEDDMPGVTTLLNIDVVWATPGHGQAKPIESFWRTISETDKRAEFAGAYCGADPLDKPEEFDPKKAVPLAAYLAAVTEDIEAYNARGHRGDSMDGRSPGDVYDELMKSAVVRTPTAEQIRLCMLTAENKMLDADHGVTVLGNRYWTEALAKLPSRGPFTARYDPDDASTPVAVYDGDRFLCEAALYVKSGFRDQEAAKSHQRSRNAFKKATKVQAKALADQAEAGRWDAPRGPMPIAPQAGDAPSQGARVAELVTPKRRGVSPSPEQQASEDYAIAGRLGAAVRAKRAREEEENEGWDRRAAGAR
ncbi:MAG: hypothetical protein A3E25_17840 [Burkholderiales bacterium RIFCSPHIGHO2_12_FULL_69_20]|nr:MAG: hypothetical protein A3E25_17840 [Burkholderiales bacterium RIFCSPHIGHO2_12_FULL_69_20]